MGACLYRGKAKDVFAAGDHQSTFGGNPLACAAANVVLKTINDKAFLADVVKKGDYIRSQIAGWKSPLVNEVRGKGLMIGVDLNDKASALEIEKKVLAAGLCTSTAGKNTLRLVPPLNISQEEIDAGLAILKEAL